MKKNLIKCVLPMIVIIVGILWYLLSREVKQDVLLDETLFGLKQEAEVYAESENVSGEKDMLTTSATFIAVHVCGAVVNPGVYQLEAGVRVIQVIEAAGGVCAGAMQDYLNLAETVNDGDKIYVPTKEEVESGYVQANTDTVKETVLCVNINTATKSELMQLPGIGESKADSIISYREEHGYFKSAEDIMLINGIKEAVYRRIKDYIKVKN